MRREERVCPIDIALKEHILHEAGSQPSDSVKINGNDIMDILGEKMRTLTFCSSYLELIGKNTDVIHTYTKEKSATAIPRIC